MSLQTDLALLYAAILENPDEDTPRLMYADACEEAGDSVRAVFIRNQYRRREIGPQRMRVDVGSVHESRGGPGYFEFTGGEGDGLSVGMRVDLIGTHEIRRRGLRMKRTRKPRILKDGVVIVKIDPDDHMTGVNNVTCKTDSGSVPYPHEEAATLDKEIRTALEANWRIWTTLALASAALYVGDEIWCAASGFQVGFDRGFPSVLLCNCQEWVDRNEEHRRNFPITDIRFIDRAPRLWARAELPLWTYSIDEPGLKTGTAYEIKIPDRTRARLEVSGGLEAAENKIRRDLLQRQWYTIPRWTWPGFDGV